ncbi:hypothetical protein HPB48_026843 [Haemaphysalis longicornis]|uniref:Uncharacterized protein n=1 Tax=Haemaphysalis longicornis TaxID=44386 RepID=A0A9J6HDD0_HAELO|nr:hypothetical protein HPB48_026843 [Haemaphysalis longicornis]
MRVWNLFGLAVNLSPVMRQNRFCLRLLYKYPDSYPLGLLNGHNALVSGTYKHALGGWSGRLSVLSALSLGGSCCVWCRAFGKRFPYGGV